MKSSLKTSLGFLLMIFILSCSKRDKQENIFEINNSVIFKENSNIEKAQLELKNALLENKILTDKVISDSQTAVKVAEDILFKIYGEENIVKQRPYNVKYVEDYYIINGTMPAGIAVGGTFLIIISSKDGKIIKLTHGE